MRLPSIRRRIGPRVAGLLAAALFASGHPGNPSGETILRNVQSRLAGVKDYTVTLDIVADIERLNVPPMHLTMYFKQPDKIHLEAEGFAMLPREGLALDVGKLLLRYDIAGVDRDTVDNTSLYEVTLRAKSESNPLRTITVGVNPGHWTVDRLVTPHSGGRAISVSFTHVQVDSFWLPSELTAVFSNPADSTEEKPVEQAAPLRMPSRPGNGVVRVRYSGYHINTGLSDDIFSKDSLPPPK